MRLLKILICSIFLLAMLIICADASWLSSARRGGGSLPDDRFCGFVHDGYDSYGYSGHVVVGSGE